MVHEDSVDLAVMKARRVNGLSEQLGGLLAVQCGGGWCPDPCVWGDAPEEGLCWSRDRSGRHGGSWPRAIVASQSEQLLLGGPLVWPNKLP